METPKRNVWDIIGAIGAATVASVCCVLPLALVSLGIGGAWMSYLTALVPYRPLFIILAVGALGFAFYREYKTSTGPDCECDAKISDPVRRGLLLVATVATIGLIGSPYLLPASASTISENTDDVQGIEHAMLGIEGMTCASCTTTAERALTRLDGVHGVQVTYEPPEARVQFDPSIISADELAAAITNVGYQTHVKSSDSRKINRNIWNRTERQNGFRHEY